MAKLVNTTIYGTLTTTSNATFSNTISVTDNATFSNTISVTGNATFSNTITLTGIYANGSLGTSGQLLTSNGTTVYWSTPVQIFDYGLSYAFKTQPF